MPISIMMMNDFITIHKEPLPMDQMYPRLAQWTYQRRHRKQLRSNFDSSLPYNIYNNVVVAPKFQEYISLSSASMTLNLYRLLYPLMWHHIVLLIGLLQKVKITNIKG